MTRTPGTRCGPRPARDLLPHTGEAGTATSLRISSNDPGRRSLTVARDLPQPSTGQARRASASSVLALRALAPHSTGVA
jgi:hypothetical protein